MIRLLLAHQDMATTYNYARIASDNWESNASAADEADTKQAANEDVAYIRKFRNKIRELPDLFHKIANVLEAPELAVTADKVATLSADLAEISERLEVLPSLVDRLEAAVNDFLNELASGQRELRGGLVEAVGDLPEYTKLEAVSKQIGALHSKVKATKIDWDISEFIGTDCGVYKKLEVLDLEDPDELQAGSIGYGYLAAIGDPKWLGEALKDLQEYYAE